MMLEADIFVAGLGPAGAAAAHAAARAGCRVVGVDRKHVPGVPVQCAEFVPALVAQEAGDIASTVRQTISRMETFVEASAGDVRDDFRGVMIDRARFDAALVERAREAGAICEFDAAIETITAEGCVALSDGRTVRARIVVGADGPRSTVARLCQIEPQDIAESRQMTVALQAGSQSTDIFLSSAIVGGYGWLFPKGDRANLGIGVARAERHNLKPLLDALHQRLIAEGRVGAEVFSYTGGPIPVGGLTGPTGRAGVMPVLLAGDAAGLANPVTGAGINAAVVSGAMAGASAAQFIAGTVDAVEDYADDLRELFEPALQRALRHRKRLIALSRSARPDDLRAGWIAYDQYWLQQDINRGVAP